MLNGLRTGVLLAVLTAIFMGVGYLLGGTGGMWIAFGVALVTNLFSYWNSDTLVLSLQHAREITPQSVPGLYEMVEELSRRAAIPAPKLYLIDTEQPNAFATGRNPQNAAVAISTGLLNRLEPDEVAGVIAHELAHIKNRDTLLMTITATFAGAISMLAQFGLFFGGRNNNSPLGGVGALVAVIVAPLAAALVQMAISRTREYQADHDGAQISGAPLALASALEKISALAQRIDNPWARRNPGMAHLYIANPLAGYRMDNLFATHPNVENRVAALQNIAAEMHLDDRGRRPPPRAGQTRPGTTQTGGGWRVPPIGPTEGDGPRGPWG